MRRPWEIPFEATACDDASDDSEDSCNERREETVQSDLHESEPPVEDGHKASAVLQEKVDLISGLCGDTWSMLGSEGPFEKVSEMQFSFSIADPKLPDCPLVAVSDGFCHLTGWSRSIILGRNCRFLNQGCELDAYTRTGLRETIETGKRFVGVLENVKKDGSYFYNHLELRGLRIGRVADGSERLLIIGIQADVSSLSDEARTSSGGDKLDSPNINLGNSLPYISAGHAKKMKKVAELICKHIDQQFLQKTASASLDALVEVYSPPAWVNSGEAMDLGDLFLRA